MAVNEILCELHIRDAMNDLPDVPLPQVALAFKANPRFDTAKAAELLKAQPGRSLDEIAELLKQA